MTEGMSPSKWEKEYEKGVPHWAKDMEPSLFVKDFAKELEKRKANTVLEIGCGNGRDSLFLAGKGFKVTAIDVSPSAVELAKSNVEKAGKDVAVKEETAESLSFLNGSFDAVFSLSVLHSTNLHLSLPEVYRVLKSGGYGFIYIYGDTQLSDGKVNVIISVDAFIKLLKTTGFIIWDFYTEEDDKKDSFGEKHKIYVVKVGKG